MNYNLQNSQSSKAPDPLLSTREAAVYLGVSYSMLTKLRGAGGGPDFSKLGTRVLYRASKLEAWLDSRGFSSTSEYS